jgi:hypothetical protein
MVMLAGTVGRLERRVMALEPSAWMVAACAAGLSAFAFWQYYDAGLVVLHGDAAAHLNIARRVVDSATPGFAQLGNVWLPLPHLLMLPTIWNDTMWHTGLSGSLPSMLAFILATIYIYRTVVHLTDSGIAALLGAALFATNGNALYMQATPMTEMLTLLFISGTTFHLLRWSQTGSSFHLVVSAMFVCAGTLTRYEAWALVPAGLIVVAIAAYKRGGRRQAEGLIFVWAPVAVYGIILWLAWNEVIFHHLLGFSTGEGTASAFAATEEAVGRLPTKHDVLYSIATYGWAVIDNMGLPLIALGVLGSLAFLLSKRAIAVKAAVLVSLSIFAFHVFALFMGESVLWVPNLAPYGLYNVRYGVLMLPVVAVGAGYFARLRFVGPLLAVMVLLPQLLGLSSLTIDPSAAPRAAAIVAHTGGREQLAKEWADDNFPWLKSGQQITMVDPMLAKAGVVTNTSDAAAWLRENAKNGRILVSARSLDEFLFETGLDMSQFITEGNKPMFQEELLDPGKRAQWIVIRATDTGAAVDEVKSALGDQPPKGFTVAYDDGIYRIFHESVSQN